MYTVACGVVCVRPGCEPIFLESSTSSAERKLITINSSKRLRARDLRVALYGQATLVWK